VVCGGAVVPGESYGAFRTARDARQALQRVAAERGLCDIRLGLQSGSGPCFGHQIKRCRGACVGVESPAQHDLRLAEALQAIRIARWPYAGPIGLREGGDEQSVQHVIDQWIYLGAARDLQDVDELLRQTRPAFDLDTYRILLRFMNDPQHGRAVRPLVRPALSPLSAPGERCAPGAWWARRTRACCGRGATPLKGHPVECCVSCGQWLWTHTLTFAEAWRAALRANASRTVPGVHA
jgi:hypothetical protein